MSMKARKESYEAFAARIWDTMLPNGVRLRDATGADVAYAASWFKAHGERLALLEENARKERPARRRKRPSD